MELVSRSPTRDCNQKQCIGINDVPHNLLIEILHRLPLKSAKQCMLVSKLWYSLMSSSYFAHRFLEINYSSALVLTYQDDDYDPIPRIIVAKENSIIRSELFSFSYLPFEQMSVAKLVALCQDLVLCQVGCCRNVSDSIYYICNPLTRSWIRLPLNPPNPPRAHQHISHGLVFRGSGHSFMYAVLMISSYGRNYVKVQIFTSDSAIWSEKKLTFGCEICGYPFLSRASISYQGMLFWVATSPVLIGLDPFNVGGSCRLIDLPPGLPDAHFNVAVCNGNLRLFATRFDYQTEVFYIRVWDLNDYENDEWHLEHDISFSGLLQSEDITWFVEMFWIINLACDPKDGDIMYLHMGDSTIVSCNMRTKTFDVLCECDHIFPDIDAKERGFDAAFLYELPWQPTSIHALPLQNRSHNV